MNELLVGMNPAYSVDPLVKLVRTYLSKKETRSQRVISNTVEFTKCQLLETLSNRLFSNHELRDAFRYSAQSKWHSVSFGACSLSLVVEPGGEEYPAWGCFHFSCLSEPIYFCTRANGPTFLVHFRGKEKPRPTTYAELLRLLKMRKPRVGKPKCEIQQTTAAELVEKALMTIVQGQIQWEVAKPEKEGECQRQ